MIELPEIRIWQHKKNKFWYAGIDRSMVMFTTPGSIETFLKLKEHAVQHGYQRDVVLESRIGTEVRTHVP